MRQSSCSNCCVCVLLVVLWIRLAFQCVDRGFCYPVIKQTSVTMQDTLVASVMAPSTTERQSEPVGSHVLQWSSQVSMGLRTSRHLKVDHFGSRSDICFPTRLMVKLCMLPRREGISAAMQTLDEKERPCFKSELHADKTSLFNSLLTTLTDEMFQLLSSPRSVNT